jgi:hypothetical protein
MPIEDGKPNDKSIAVEDVFIPGDAVGNLVIGENNTDGNGKPLVTNLDYQTEIPTEIKSNSSISMPNLPQRGDAAIGKISVRGKITGNMLVGDNVNIEGQGHLIQKKLEEIQINPDEEAKQLTLTKERIPELGSLLISIESKEGLDNLFINLKGNFATSEFLVTEYIEATKNDNKVDWLKVRKFAKLLVDSDQVNKTILREKLNRIPTKNSAQGALLDAISWFK